MKSCLLLIDAQASFTRRPYYNPADVATYLHGQNRLIAGFVAAALPVVRILHASPDGDANDPFAIASGLVRPLDGLADFPAAATFHKSRHSALVGTGLDVWLTQQGIGELVISGIRTEQCCETTTRHASDLGWSVRFVPEATLTFAMQLPDATPFTPADITARTVAVLKDRFARINTVDEVLDHVRAD